MRFEWDEEKRKSNFNKHGVDFADVEQIFFDECYAINDDRFDYGETRFLSLYLLVGEVIAVIYTETDKTVRIISARREDKYEQQTYYKEIRD